MNKYFMSEEKGDCLNIIIYGDITSWEWLESDVSSYTLSKLIQESNARMITVNINSYGGEISEALAIYNALRNHPASVMTVCDGFACSAASVVFMAGDERVMNEASLLFVHNAWTYASGNAAELRKQAEDLEIMSNTAAKAYMARVGISEGELQKLLDAESWIKPEEAVEMGFATSVNRQGDNPRQQYSAKGIIIGRLVGGENHGGIPGGNPERGEEPGPGSVGGFQKLFGTFK